MAQEIDQNVVIADAAFVVSDYAFIHAQHLTRLNHQPSFFAGFTGYGFAQGFSAFENSAGEGPLAQQRSCSSAD